MKNLLGILGAVSLTAIGTSCVVACNKTATKEKKQKATPSKINLSYLNKLTLNIDAENNKILSDLNSKIINANEFKNKPLGKEYQINYYANKNNNNDISNFPQTHNTKIYVIITAKENNINYEGKTKKIEIILN